MADVFGHYAQDLAGSAAWDEVFEAAERPRSHYAALCDTLRLFSAADMAERKAGLDRAFQHAGITVDHDGPEQAWPLDLVPRLLTASEWDLIQRGVRQRVKALEGFLADVDGPQEILKDGIVPPHVVFASRGYHRLAGQFAASHGVRVHVAGVDLVRDEAGRFRVLEDNIRVPSGVSYVLENRHAMTKVLPEAFTRLLAWTGPQLVGRRALVFVHPDDQIRAIANWVAMLQSPDDQVRVRLRHRHADGTWLWFEVINLHRLADPQHGDVLGEMVEITDEMAAQEALRTRTLLLQRLTESLPMGVAQLDLARRIVYRNERLDAVLGTTAQRLDEQLAGLDDRDRTDTLAAVERALADNVDADLEVAVASQRCAIVVRPLLDDAGCVSGAILIVTDITDSVRLRDQLERRASYDALTGCRNRESVFAELGERLSARHRASPGVAVVFVDLDRFKSVNDQYGHAAGDRLLQATGDRLLGAVRAGDIVGRIGGDEFLIVASPVADRTAALHVAQRVAQSLRGLLIIDGEILDTTASIGVAWTDQPIEPDVLVAAADAAMYTAKETHDGRPVLSDHAGQADFGALRSHHLSSRT